MKAPCGRIECGKCGICLIAARYRLTSVDVLVIALLLVGMSYEEMAATLGRSERTIRDRSYRICQKVGADNKLNVALWAIARLRELSPTEVRSCFL